MANKNRSSHEDALCSSEERFTCAYCIHSVCFCAGTVENEITLCNFCVDFQHGAAGPYAGMTYEEAEVFNWSAEWWATREKGEREGLMRDDFKNRTARNAS